MDVFDKIVELLLRADDKDCIERMLVLFDSDIDHGDRSVLWRRFNSIYDSKMKALIVSLIKAVQVNTLSDRLKDIYANNKDATWRNVYATRVFTYSQPTSNTEYTKLETLFESGKQEEAVSQALKILDKSVREGRSYDLFLDLYRNGEVLLILGKAAGEDILEVINKYTQQEYIDHYQKVYEKFGESQSGNWRMSAFHQNGIMALARLGGKSVIPKLRQFYNSDNIRIKIVSALALYYNGDMTGEKLVRKFVEGSHLEDPEIALRWGQDISDGTVFQDIISSYLRNDLTDALLLEKMSNYLDRADINVESEFFKEHKPEILRIAVKHLNNKDRAIRGYAITILYNATGQNFGFDPDKYHGRQDDIIQKWNDYLAQEYPSINSH
jgi:hypothetical protein